MVHFLTFHFRGYIHRDQHVIDFYHSLIFDCTLAFFHSLSISRYLSISFKSSLMLIIISSTDICSEYRVRYEMQAVVFTSPTFDWMAIWMMSNGPYCCFFLQIFGDYYHFQHRKVAKRSLTEGTLQSNKLDSDPDVSIYCPVLPLLQFIHSPV